jgi:hypothetical protein
MGLSQLITLFERDDAPRSKTRGAEDVAAWCREHLVSATRVQNVPERLVSNWLSIHHLPEYVRMYDIDVPADQIGEVVARLSFPIFRYLRLIGSFANAEDLSGQQSLPEPLTQVYAIPLSTFLKGNTAELPGLGARAAQNFVSNLLRQTWDSYAKSRGLVAYEVSSGAIAWFLPANAIEGNRVSFVDQNGKRRRKSVVGWSPRRQVYWHFALELYPVIARLPRMVARAHIAFTADGRSLLEDKDQVHLLRRRFCRNWWNDRWRDLLLAFVAFLAGDNDKLVFDLGEGTNVGLCRQPLSLISPVSLGPDIAPLTDEADDDWLDYSSDDEEGHLEPDWEGEVGSPPSETDQ